MDQIRETSPRSPGVNINFPESTDKGVLWPDGLGGQAQGSRAQHFHIGHVSRVQMSRVSPWHLTKCSVLCSF